MFSFIIIQNLRTFYFLTFILKFVKMSLSELFELTENKMFKMKIPAINELASNILSGRKIQFQSQ